MDTIFNSLSRILVDFFSYQNQLSRKDRNNVCDVTRVTREIHQ